MVYWPALARRFPLRGVNAVWFSRRQIYGTLTASACLGLVCGLGLAFLPPYLAGAGAGLVFAIMSERLLATFVPRLPARIVIMLCIATLSGILAHFATMLSLCGVLLLYTLFAIYDLRKNWNKPKEPLFPAELLRGRHTGTPDAASSISLNKRPNIYVLFLESFHSRAALQALYGVGDDGLTDFLTARGFTVFENSLANACWTQQSLQTLLRMAHYDPHAEGTPEAIRYLHANGYEIQLLDTYMYTFKTYIPWASWHNFTIPAWVLWLYTRMLPLFMQSKCLMAVTGNIDPFTDASDYTEVRNALEQRMHKKYTHPPMLYHTLWGHTRR